MLGQYPLKDSHICISFVPKVVIVQVEIVAVQCLFVYNIFGGKAGGFPMCFRHLYRENVAYKMARILVAMQNFMLLAYSTVSRLPDGFWHCCDGMGSLRGSMTISMTS